MDVKIRVGRNIKKFRQEIGLSQEKLAFKANIDRTYLPGIEKGERNISIVVLEKIAKALELDIKELF